MAATPVLQKPIAMEIFCPTKSSDILRPLSGLASSSLTSSSNFRKTTDFVEKATWTLAIVIMVLSIATVFVSHNGQQSSVSEIKDIVNTEAPAALPGFETPATGNNAAPAQEAPVQEAPAN